MFLAYCLAHCEDELMCDLAQYYHIYDWEAMPLSKVATFSIGLPDDSRVKRKISKSTLSLTDMLLALLVDGVNQLIWQRTKDGAKNRNRPKSLFNKLTNKEQEQEKDKYQSFESIDDFNRWYEEKHICQK